MPDPYQPKPFSCDVAHRGDPLFVCPTGNLDMGTAPILEDTLRELVDGGARRVIVDLRGLGFMDSTGITLVTRFNLEARNDGFNFGLVPGPPRVMRLFELTGLAEYFTFVPG